MSAGTAHRHCCARQAELSYAACARSLMIRSIWS